MPRRLGILALAGALILVTGNVWAQAPAGMQETVRPATTSIYGDTGLWFVPTGEVLRDKTWSASAYRMNWDVRQGFTDISHFEGTFAYGIRNKAEIFGAVRFITRIDRDTRPIFGFGDDRYGGVDNNYPFVREGWIGNSFGDSFVGGKFNLMSESRMHKLALAVRGMVKLPTGSADDGSGTGEMDTQFDIIASKEVASVAEVSGSFGYRFRGDPDEYDLSDGFPFGIGVQGPTRSALKFTAEWFGEWFADDVVTRTTGTGAVPESVIGSDGSVPLVTSNLPNQSTFMFGATWQKSNGFFAGGGIGWSAKAEDREEVGVDSDDNFGTKFGWQFRIGYHPGVAGLPVPLPPPPPPPPAAPPPSHTLTVDAQCNPCTVEVGGTSKLTATAKDSIGCAVTYQWSAPTGTFANAAQQNTVWTAPNTPGNVTATVTVTCPTDKMTATDTVALTVVARPVKTITFEDVYFDFDRFSLTDAAQRILAQAVEALRADPTLRVRIEGHTCNIGTAEYNLALGDRRARSVQQYLVSNGIAADRLTTVSFGEEQPKHDNSREETRRLNRRAAMTVNLVK
jgi:outer membrane protein OmpA-like peptidoglycan-associated protein